jgi:capsular polysaccharide transport system permease protein
MNESSATFIRSFFIQKRVIGALILREIITRYGRHNIGFFWLILEPMLFTLGVTTLWSAIQATHGTSIPITAFAVTGYSSLIIWRNCTNRAVKAIEANHSLMYHRNVRVLDIYAARLILEIIGVTSSLMILTVFFSMLGWMQFPVDVVTAMAGWALLCWFAFALSLVVGALSEFSEIIERVWHILTYLMFPLSGAAFMVDWLPKAFQNFVLWVPMLHCTEMMRHGYFGSMVKTYENPSYVIMFNLILTLLGMVLLKEVGKRIEP